MGLINTRKALHCHDRRDDVLGDSKVRDVCMCECVLRLGVTLDPAGGAHGGISSNTVTRGYARGEEAQGNACKKCRGERGGGS